MAFTAELTRTLTMILAGGRGDRLKPLTDVRAKPAVPFGGLYRIIDFTLSNCIHSGLRKIHVLTQYQARSLEEHLRFGWNFLPRRLGQYITARPPHLRTSARWYAGTADAIYQNLDALEDDPPDRVLILSGDHVYKMDYGRMLAEHIENGAALTIGAVPVPIGQAPRFGIFGCAAGGRVESFAEKPHQPKEVPGRPGWALASMGVYLFEADVLEEQLRRDAAEPSSSHDFGNDVIPQMIRSHRVYAHHFTGVGGGGAYWRDIGTLESYYEANLDLCSPSPQFNLYDSDWPTYTLQHAEPPAKTVRAEGRPSEVHGSLLCPGTVVSGGKVEQSILSYRVRVECGAEVTGSILMAGAQVGRSCVVRRAIIDKWVQVPDGTCIGVDAEEDARRFPVSESGIVVIPKGYAFQAETAPA